MICSVKVGEQGPFVLRCHLHQAADTGFLVRRGLVEACLPIAFDVFAAVLVFDFTVALALGLTGLGCAFCLAVASAAEERLQIISNPDVLGGSSEADELANALLKSKAIPETEPRDAMHISLAATNGVKYLLTWNFKHIANAKLRSKIEVACRANGFEPPIICTPDELMGVDDET